MAEQLEVIINGEQYVPMSTKLFEGDDSDTRKILLQLIGSLTLDDHIGDVADSVDKALDLMGLDIEWHDFDDLGTKLGRMGVTTLWGTTLGED